MLKPRPRIAAEAKTRLLPEQDVESGDHYFIATSTTPWLRLEAPHALLDRGWVRVRYRTSFYDNPVRPVIRFVKADGSTSLHAMNAPIFGAAEWIGRVPDDVTTVHISPTNQPGPFNFEIEYIRRQSAPALFLQLLLQKPWQTVYWLAEGLIERYLKRDFFYRALNTTSFAHYSKWLRSRTRPTISDGLDRPRLDWSKSPLIRLLILLDGGDNQALRATAQALAAQIYPRWQLHALCGPQTPPELVAEFSALNRHDARFSFIDDTSNWWPSGEGSSDYWCGAIGLGDTMPDYALAVMIEAIGRRWPLPAVLYSDEDAIAADAALGRPIFKPDWSPYFHSGAQFIGRLTLIRGQVIEASAKPLPEFLRAEHAETVTIVERCPRHAVFHVRRVLCHRAEPPSVSLAKMREGHTLATATDWPKVTIIIPTRDRADLLNQCLAGLRHTTDYPHWNAVIVDNGTTQRDALTLFDELRTDDRFSISSRPGKFNFSALGNLGAASSQADALVFLNNDVSMIRSDWLKPMVRWAMHPDVGAVGPKLKFPNGTIQHAGVVLSLDDLCLHKYRKAPGNEAGYMAELRYPHEVSAVTGACLVVERRKFNAVGGFNAEKLPVDLSDIDLCLKLAAQGWTSIWTPEAELYHHEFATRGLPEVDFHRAERTIFLEKWRDVIRDDPYFHPALLVIPNSHIALG